MGSDDMSDEKKTTTTPKPAAAPPKPAPAPARKKNPHWQRTGTGFGGRKQDTAEK
jgi:hypothetical protein